jgi:hypothetical protein
VISKGKEAYWYQAFPSPDPPERRQDRPEPRALLQYFRPENDFEVHKALMAAGRQDLIGSGCDCLIPGQPPKETLQARRRRANEDVNGDHDHAVADPAKSELFGERGLPKFGYRPGRKSARRQDKQGKRKGGR